MKRVYIENLGCAKNQVDAEVMLQFLTETREWEYTEDPSAADLILVNTCAFLEIAREESIHTLLSLRASYPSAKVVMTGCLSERYAEMISEDLPESDGFFGNRDLSYITWTAEEVMEGRRAVEIPRDYQDHTVYRRKLFSFPGSAFLKISEGCSHRCRYCSIPLIRGDLRSREIPDVLNELSRLSWEGIREVNFIAQDLAAFGTDRSGRSEFLDLLRQAVRIEGDFRIRLLYIHPDAFPSELLEFAASEPRIMPYFDIPFQHAAKKVLRGMGRKGDIGSYLGLVRRIRDMLPDSVIRSTFLLGFPGEGEDEFQELKEFITSARMDWAGTFIYSREEGTPAYDDRGAAAHRKAVRQAEDRKHELEALQMQITESNLDRWIGREVDVLIEEIIPEEDLAIGRGFMQAPEVDGAIVVLSSKFPPGDMVSCRITRRNGIDLEAEPLEGGDAYA